MNKKLLFLLVLLLTATTGAVAQTETLLTTITPTAKEQASYSTANVATVSFSYTADGSSAYLANWGWWGYGWSATVTAAEGYTITKCIFYDDANRTATDSEAPFVVETTEEDKTPRINETPIDGGNMWSKGIKKIEVYGYATYSVTLAEGTEDTDNWTIDPTEAAEGSPVTATYSGEKKVKSVKAVKKKAVDPAKAYMKWDADQKKFVATEIPESFTTVTSSTMTWEAGTYVVEGEVNITGTIELSGDVDLIIKDGAKLTAQGINGASKNLSIYGQANQSGQLVVGNSGTDAISYITTLEVHSAEVTAASSSDYCGGFFNIFEFNVYGGSVDAKCTGSNGLGIGLIENGSMNIYGGEVKAEGTGSGGIFYFHNDNKKPTVTVYGGKLWAGCTNKALYYINLQKGTGFTGKIETCADNSAWAEYNGDTTPGSKYVRVGY